MIDDFDRARLILEDLEWWGPAQTQYDERDIGWAIEITLARVDGVFDDRARVCRMWYAKGIPLFRVGDPDAEF